MRTSRQIEIINFLESLVHHRFSIEQLNEKLSKEFKENIEVYNKTQDYIDRDEEDPDQVLCDYNLMFNSENEDTYGYFDIYMLPMRKKSFDGADMYITEISYEFE